MADTHLKERSLFDPEIMRPAIWESFRKLTPRHVIKNPVMFVVEIGSVLSTLILVRDLFAPTPGSQPLWFTFNVSFWLWFTVVFANFAEAVAEGRGKGQAAKLRKMRKETNARRLVNGHREEVVPASALRKGDTVVVEAGEIIPGDGDVIQGIASVDESAITGESAPVIRESGGDRSAVTGGTKVLSDRIVVRITASPGESFLDRMIALVEGAERQKTPNEVALNILLAGLTLVFLFACVTLVPMAIYSGMASFSVTVIVALLVCLIPTTIGGLLSAIGIAGIDRLLRKNVLAKSGRSVEAAGDVDTLLLDKTGTITIGNREATELLPIAGVTERALAEAAMLASLADETPEGRSIVRLIGQKFSMAAPELRRMGIRTVMITGDNKLTAAAIAAEAGVDDFLAQATPEDKLQLIRDEQAKGKLVAMCGDGTNDAPALAQSDVGVAMNTGTQAAREAGNMVDLDSNPTKLIEVVEIGKQLLMTRGALTTFSIANDVAKYFAIIPAMFASYYPQLEVLNVMHLASPQSAILSAIIFNALVIIALIPLALKGVAYRAVGAGALLRRNLMVYGLGGIIIPFIGIKLIDLVVAALNLA